MKNIIKHTLLVAFATLFVSACSTPEVEYKNNDKKLIDLIKHFESYGITIESIQELESNFFHAEEAIAVTIDNEEIGVYRFDLAYFKAKRKVDMVTKKKTFFIQAIPFPAVINGSFMMINHDKHKRGKEFEKIFADFTSEDE